MRINYHLHNQYSSDGRGTTEEVCDSALESGFQEICLTNHAEILDPKTNDWVVDLVEARDRFEQLQQEIERTQPRYPDLRILLGVEVEFRPEWVESLDALIDSVDFDLVLGSVHVVDGHQVSGGVNVGAYFRENDATTAYRRYFEVVDEMVEWGAFDIVSHLDLVKRFGVKYFGPFDPRPLESRIRALLGKIADRGLGIEVNTSGAVQAPREPYPGLSVLRWARETGISTVTIGTDSHVPPSIDQGWESGARLLRQAGFAEVTLFSHRVRANVPLVEVPEEEG